MECEGELRTLYENRELHYWTVAIALAAQPKVLGKMAGKDQCYLGPHVRLAGESGKALLDSEALARQYADACLPILQDRYGTDVGIELQATVARGGIKWTAKKVEKHSEIVRTRLDEGNFAPNRFRK